MLKPSAPGLAAAAIALVTDVLYIAVILSEDNDPIVGVVLVVAVLIGGAGVACAMGSLSTDPRLRAALLWPAAAVLIVIGLLAILSVGLPLLVAGALASTAAVRARSSGAQLPQR